RIQAHHLAHQDDCNHRSLVRDDLCARNRNAGPLCRESRCPKPVHAAAKQPGRCTGGPGRSALDRGFRSFRLHTARDQMMRSDQTRTKFVWLLGVTFIALVGVIYAEISTLLTNDVLESDDAALPSPPAPMSSPPYFAMPDKASLA